MLTGDEIQSMYVDMLEAAEEVAGRTIAAGEQIAAVVLQVQSEVTNAALVLSADRMRIQLKALHDMQHRVFGLLHEVNPAAVEEMLSSLRNDLAEAEEKLQPRRAA